MFSPIIKQVTSKFQSPNKQQILSQINRMLSAAIPQVPVESSQLYPLRLRGKVKPVAKAATDHPAKCVPPVSPSPAAAALPTVPVLPSVSTNQAWKKTNPEKPSNVEQKHNPRGYTKSFLAREKSEQSKTQIPAGVPPKATVSPRKVDSTKIIAFGSTLANPVMLPDFRRKNPISGGHDFRVNKSAYKPTVSTIFSYDLSPLERNDYGLCHKNSMNPMKSVPATEVQLLQSGQRSIYLEERYKLTPDVKYNYPEATSMRYGWFHRLGDPFQKRVARKD
ncbi:hypothetical protein KR032_002814 [Drosophila birchii]|nr:hypothetical protein KR032_002814 [Drosophila birchii]